MGNLNCAAVVAVINVQYAREGACAYTHACALSPLLPPTEEVLAIGFFSCLGLSFSQGKYNMIDVGFKMDRHFHIATTISIRIVFLS